MAGRTQSHGYEMPIDFYLKKNEVTCMRNNSIEDDHNNLDTYYRQQLKDFREAPSQFEQDQHRYDNHSRERLSLRYNLDRSEGVMPWLPDGTFLDQVFLNDVGNSMLPDFKELREQIDLRVRDIPLYTDEDYSVPSKEVSATDHITNKDILFEQSKQRFKIFDTSRDYMITPTIIGKPLHGASQLNKMITDQVPDFMAEEAATNQNWQVDMSNKLHVGWQTTPDIVYKVAKYDTPRKMADQSVDAYNNRIGGRMDTDFLISFEGKNIPRSVVLTMMDIMRQRKRLMYNAQYAETQYGISNQDYNRKLNQLNQQLKELMRRYSQESACPSSNQLLKSERKNTDGRQYMHKIDPYKIYKSEAGIQLTDLIMKATRNRKLGRSDTDDLRGQIEKTANDFTRMAIDTNKKNKNIDPSNQMKMLRMSHADYKKPDPKVVFNYAGVHIGDRAQMAGSHNMFDVQEYKRLQHPDMLNRRITTQNNLYTPDVVDYEQRKTINAEMRNIRARTDTHNGALYTSDDRQLCDLSDTYSQMHTQPTRRKTHRLQ